MKTEVKVERARPEQFRDLLALFPRLADFSIPQRRTPKDLWDGDAKLLEQWVAGDLPEAIVLVALDSCQTVLGVAFSQLRPEALSGRPAAHLEVLAVAEGAERRGVGSALMTATEREVKRSGAKFLTLNVFHGNKKARGLYQKLGFDEEMIRCIKDLS